MKVLTTLAATALLGCSLMADGAAIYETCKQCHGANGEKVAPGGNSKVINTMSKADIVAALQGYKAGTYGGKTKAMMKAPVAGLSDAQMQEVADFIGQ
jgi:cytochrome c